MMEETLMIRPDRCLSKARANARVNRNAPFKFVSRTVSQSASLRRMTNPSRVIPALFTRMSTRPVSARILPPVSATALESATSSACAHALRPSARTSPATFSAFSAVRETQTMSAPAAANFSAIARPIPRPAPVTTAT